MEYVIKYKYRGGDRKFFHSSSLKASITMQLMAKLRRYSDYLVVYITREPPIDDMFVKADNGDIFHPEDN